VTVVVIDEPRGNVFGGVVAGPAWRAITERALVMRGRMAALARDFKGYYETGRPTNPAFGG
jgi:hypothetical protein